MTSSPEGEGGVAQKMTNDDMMTGGGGVKRGKRKLCLSFQWWFFGGGGDGVPTRKNHPVCLVLWFQKKLTSGPRLQRAFNYGQETNIRCFSRRQYWCELHAPGGVVAKKRQMMTRGRGGHDTPQNWWCHLCTGPNSHSVFPGILHLF